MVKLYRFTGWNCRSSEPVSLPTLLENHVRLTSYDAPGELETLRAEVRTLTELLGIMAEALPDAAQNLVAQKLGAERVMFDIKGNIVDIKGNIVE